MRTRLAAGILAVLAWMGTAGAGTAQDSPEAVHDRAYEALQNGDLPAAAEMLKELGDSGVAQGYTMLGEMKRDLGDRIDAARWFERGADGGDTAAMIQGAELIADPGGVNDPRRALKLWLAAAGKGVARGQYEAGKALLEGHGAPSDPKTGADWLEQAARQCFGEAQIAYAQALRLGKGRKADGEEALAWVISAERSKEDWSAERLEELATLEREIPAYMSSAQVRRAYCRGLALFADSCGGGGILFRIERWTYCK